MMPRLRSVALFSCCSAVREGAIWLPQLHFALIGELGSTLDHPDGVVIDAKALRARVARGFGECGLDEIEAVEAVLGSEPAVGDRE